MENLPVILKKGRPFLENLSNGGSVQRAVCPREKLISFIDDSGHVIIHLISDDLQRVQIDSDRFLKYQWVVSSRAQPDCIVDQRSEHKSDLLAVTSSLDCQWFSVSDVQDLSQETTPSPREVEPQGTAEGESPVTIKVECLAVLKKAELCTKLRKLDFPDVLESVVLLGSEGGQALLLFNSSLVCHLVLDQEFGCIALAGCYVLQLSLLPYQDDQLPASPGPLASYVYADPLLFTLTAEGIVFVYRASSGSCVGVINIMDYWHYYSGRTPDFEILQYHFEHLSVSPDLSCLAVSLSTNQLVLVNIPDYYQIFGYHYHLDFNAKSVKSHQGSKATSSSSHFDISKEEEEERWQYGGLAPHQHKERFLGSFPGNYAWTCRLDNLEESVSNFSLSKLQSLDFCQSSRLTDFNEAALKLAESKTSLSIAHPAKKAWYEEVQSAVTVGGQVTCDTQFVSTLSYSRDTERDSADTPATTRRYNNHCFLPAACQEDSKIIRMDFVCDLVVTYYGQCAGLNSDRLSQDHAPAVGMATYYTDSKNFSYIRLPQPCWLVQTSHPEQLMYLANDQSLSVTSFNLTQEEFVGKVLMFGSASVAEEVCHLNRWDQCSLPINALETALELRQLDTLAFFLRSRDNDTSEEQSQEASLPPLPPDQLDVAVELLIGAIQRNFQKEDQSQFASQLLIMTLGFIMRMIKNEVIREEYCESQQAKPVEPVECSELKPEEESASVPLKTLTSYIQQLRAFLPESTARRDEGKQEDVDEEELHGQLEEGADHVIGFIDKALMTDWDKLDPKEVIKEALLRSCLPMAQAYLLQRKPEEFSKQRASHSFDFTSSGQSIADALDDYPLGQKPFSSSLSHNCDVSLRCLQVTAIGYMVEALQKRNVKLASSILTHIGLDVLSSLRCVCLYTLDIELRNFLSKELISHKQMSDTEVAALEYLHILESYYPLQSYDQAHQRQSKHTSNKTAFQATALPVIPGIMSRTTAIPSLGNLQDLYPETYGGDCALSWDPVLPPSSRATLYLQVPLAAVLCWDDATKQRVLFESFVLSGQTEGTECQRIVNKKHIFDYYVSHNDMNSAMNFLASGTPPIENSAICPAYIISCCSAMTNSTTYFHNTLLNELARNGVFVPAELGDFPTFLYRLGCVHSLFTYPHPLSKVAGQSTEKDTEDSFSPIQPENSLVSLESFHKKFLNYLVENRFYSLLYHYLDSYGLGLDESSIALLEFDAGHPWVDVLLRYRLASLNPSDPNIIFQASLSCGHLLLSSDLVSHEPNVMKMLENGRVLMAIATLMYAPVPLEDAISKSNSNQLWYAESAIIRQAIAAYPSLQAAIFPPSPTSLTPSQSQDITLYELLQDTVPFDIGRLFKWQDTNTVQPPHDEASISTAEFPHFSSSALAEKFALSEHLDYVYYLHRGQPSFAFANFVAAKLLGHSNPRKRIDRLMLKVYRLAMHDFTNSRLGSSCAALMEMLGRDSTSFRIDLQCANRIAKHGDGKQPNNDTVKASPGRAVDNNLYKKLVLQFCHLCKSHNDAIATSLLTQLELATQTLISNSGVEVCGLEAEECWQLVQSFCQYHQLPPSLAFLTVCAETGQWLPLLCNAQLYSVAAQKVLTIVERSFSNPCIKEHLTLAISSMDSSQPPTSPLPLKGNGASDRSKTRKRRGSSASKTAVTEKAQNLVSTQPDLRVKFYSRVGLQREVTPQPEPKPLQEGDKEEREEEQSGSATNNVFEGIQSTVSPPLQKVLPPALLETELPTDLFSAIFKSQTYECAWQALLAHAIALQRPLLAILAGSYENASAVECTCAWLLSLLDSSMFDKLTMQLSVNNQTCVPEDQLRFTAEIQWRSWSTLDLSLMLISAMQHSPSPAAYFSLVFHYFDGNSPLLSFLKFHEEFVLRNDCEESKKYLKEFQLNMDKSKSFGFAGAIGDILWVEQVTSSMASHMLAMCPTPFERSHLLQLLHETHFGEGFECSVLDFSELYQMSCVLNEAGLASDAAFTIKEHFSTVLGLKSLSEIYSVRVRVDTDYVLGLLLQRGQFNIARKYASIVKSSTSQVTIKEAEYNLNQLRKSSYWEFEQARLNFWHQCNVNFHQANVESESAAEFFHSTVVNSEKRSPNESTENLSSITAMERSLLLALALKWRQQSDNLNTDQIQDLERDIWLSHIHSAMEELENSSKPSLNGSPLPFLSEVDHSTSGLFTLPGHTSLLSSLSITAQQQFKGRRQLTEFLLPDNVSVALEGKQRTTLTHKEGEAFDMMLGRLLNAGLLSQARQLAAIFEHDSPDLTIVLCCIQLCQGKLTTSQLTEGVLSLVSTRLPRHLSDPTTPVMDDPTHSSQASEIIRMLNTLSDRATYARECCNCIITCFRIALALNLSYALVINTEPYETLTQLLSSNASERYALAAKFITTCNLESKEVAAFLSECVATSLQAKHGGPGNPSDSPKVGVYQHYMSSSQFHEMAQLTSDPTLLGNLLLDMAKSLVSVDKESKQSLAIQIELLIRSHDCYTLGCSVDGIGDVLVVAQNWVQKLVQGKHFKLMVRLLTGISRYHEMGYIIGLLIEHDQFESLVHKGVEKEEQLRVALIEYLRKHGSDNEKLQMVALNFGMPRELAKTMEDQAKKEMKQIKLKYLVANNSDTVRKLKKIFDGFRDAAKTYAVEGCLNSAEHCLSQARLVALQLSVLNQNKQVINLEPKGVLKYMEDHPFAEALIVSDAYRQCIWADWISPLYKRVVIGGDFRYLSEYKTAFPLSPNIFTELAGKYQREKEKSPEAANNMKKLLAELKHLSLRQKIAIDLGWNDLVQPKLFDTGYMNDIQRL